jgi:hypothetical protein
MSDLSTFWGIFGYCTHLKIGVAGPKQYVYQARSSLTARFGATH